MKTTTLYVRIDESREIRVDFTARVDNCIPTDPGVFERIPAMAEIFAATAKIVPGGRSDFDVRSHFES